MHGRMNLQSGDLLLFRGTSCVSCFIECFSCSHYSHVGLILKDPIWLPEKGLYVLESTKISHITDVEDHQIRSGVQINLLKDVLDEAKQDGTQIYVRYLTIVRDDTFQRTLMKIHGDVHGKPYDMNLYDWICAEYNLEYRLPVHKTHQETATFWCSAVVAYIYCQLGILRKELNWSIIAPKSFSSTEMMLTFLYPLSADTLLYPLSADTLLV